MRKFKNAVFVSSYILLAMLPSLTGRLEAAGSRTDARQTQFDIARVVRKNLPDLNRCYVNKMLVDHDSGGKVRVEIFTSGNGHVSNIRLLQYGLRQSGKKNFLRCMVRKIKSWKFPVTGAYSRSFVQTFYFQ